jgi:glycosyltransferase involved in cell wall biosynthesis
MPDRPPAPAPLTAYIRTLNEESRIGATLAAAAAVASELIVVDSGSTDRTVAIAEAAGARVIRQPWLGAGAQKRVGEDAAAHDWLLDVDADEVVDAAMAASIRALFAGGEPPLPAYAANMVYVSPLPDARALGRAWRVKLYDRRRTRAPERADNVEPPAGAAAGRLGGALLHHTFADAADLTAKMNARSTRDAARAKRRGLWAIRLRILFGLPVYLAKGLIVRRFALGGVYGVATAVMIAHGRWLRDVKMYERARGLGGERAP